MVIAILSLIFSVVSLFAFWWLAIPGVILGAAALIIVNSNEYNESGNTSNKNIIRGLAIGGIIVGGIALCLIAFSACTLIALI